MKVAIVGNGISGITAARWIRKLSDFHITVISSETDHFYSRTALMYIFMGHMRFEDTKPYEDWFWDKNDINLINAHVDSIDFNQKLLICCNHKSLQYDKLILALGSKPNLFGWPGQDLNGVTGLYHYQDLERIETCSSGVEKAVIVGGGLIGVELAEMLHSRHILVTMIVREDNYWDNVLPREESIMVTNHIKENGIDLRMNSNLAKIIDNGSGSVNGVEIKETSELIECQMVGLTAGVRPNVDFLKSSELNVQKGIVVDGYLRTNIEDVFAIGDCVELSTPPKGRRPIEAVWYTGRMMGETVAHSICNDAPTVYNPGIWFNSAKFFNIEYQVYGDIPNLTPDHIESFYWQHPFLNKSIRLNFSKDTSIIRGINLMGIRFRHEICDKWLKNEVIIDHVIENLNLAHFDPEFFQEHYDDILRLFNQSYNKKIRLKNNRKLNTILKYLNSKK